MGLGERRPGDEAVHGDDPAGELAEAEGGQPAACDLGEDGEALINFTRKLLTLRKSLPILRRGRFLTGRVNEELDVKDVAWISPTGKPMEDHEWEDASARCLGMLLDGRARATGLHRPAMDITALLVANAHHDVVGFTLPQVVGGTTWHCLMDTNLPEGVEIESFDSGQEYLVTGRSALLFALEPEDGDSIALRQTLRALRGLTERPVMGLPKSDENSEETSEEEAKEGGAG